MLDKDLLIKGLYLVAITLVLYSLYWQLTTGHRRRTIIKEKGCLPMKKYPTRDPFFGIDAMIEMLRRLKERRLLELHGDRLAEINSHSMTFPKLGGKIMMTTEPENLKTIQALNFKDWSIGSNRKRNFIPLLGVGIFTTDGAEWQHSRDMLRPNFHRSQVGDLDTFENHIRHLIKAIPREGSMVDLQELFFRLTMDSATEFLFGESTFCLAPGTETVSSSKFAECFNRGQESIASRGRFGILGRIFRSDKNDIKFKEDAKFVHGKHRFCILTWKNDTDSFDQTLSIRTLTRVWRSVPSS